MKVAVLSGPYRGGTIREIVENIRRAEATALQIWGEFSPHLGIFCPHLNTALFDGILVDRIWLDFDLEMVRRGDCLILTYGWEKSEGCLAEVKEAIQNDKPIFCYPEEKTALRLFATENPKYPDAYSYLQSAREFSNHPLVNLYKQYGPPEAV